MIQHTLALNKMDTVKALLKSKSSHELLGVSNSTSTSVNKMSQPTENGNTTQFLQLPTNNIANNNGNSGHSSAFSSSVSESSELSQVSDCDQHAETSKEDRRKLKKLQKSIRKQRKRNEKQLAELVQFLHLNQSASSSKLDEDDLKYLNGTKTSLPRDVNSHENLASDSLLNRCSVSTSKSLNLDSRNGSTTSSFSVTSCNGAAAVSADASPIPPQIAAISGLHFKIGGDDEEDDEEDENEDYAEDNEKTITNNDTITANGFRRICRFGRDVADGCGFPLSLKKEADPQEKETLKRRKSWKEIIARADEYLHKQEICAQKIAIEKLFEVCPCPEVECISQGGRLPFRRWNSEFQLSPQEQISKQPPIHSVSINQRRIAVPLSRVHSSALSKLSSLANHHGGWAALAPTPRRKSCEDLRHLSSCSLVDSERDLKFGPLHQDVHHPYFDLSDFRSSEPSSERSASCSLRSVSSSCSSISGVSTLIALDLNQLELNPFEVFIQYFDPHLVAVELTKIEQELFLQLNPTELSRELFTSSRSLNVSQFFEIHCIYFFVQLILNEQHLNGRVNCLLLCIELLEELHRLRNWQSFSSVIIALHCIPIVRLKKTWLELRNSHSKAYERFCAFTSAGHVQGQALPHLLHSHHQASIPSLSELLDEMRARIAFKLNRLDNRRTAVFGKPETLTDWLTSEVRDLETRLHENQRWHEAEQEARGQKRKRSGLLKKILKSFASRGKKVNGERPDDLRQKTLRGLPLSASSNGPISSNSSSGNSSFRNENGSVSGTTLDQSSKTYGSNGTSGISSMSSAHSSSAALELLHTDEDIVDDELILMKTVNSNQRLEEWREIQMDLKLKLNKLKPETENTLLNEISKCLRFHQQLACNYELESENGHILGDQEHERASVVIRKCLVQITRLNVNSMEENLRRSLQVEPPSCGEEEVEESREETSSVKFKIG